MVAISEIFGSQKARQWSSPLNRLAAAIKIEAISGGGRPSMSLIDNEARIRQNVRLLKSANLIVSQYQWLKC